MTSRDFAYWLQGFFEISKSDSISKEQLHIIKNHLNLVFKHDIDPSMGDEKHQQELNDIHNNTYSFPTTEEEAIAKWGSKPSPKHEFNIHGWYDPAEGIPRC
jgi:hypothetical protein